MQLVDVNLGIEYEKCDLILFQVSCLGLKNKCNCGPTSGGADVCGCQNVLVG
jgi:hypothetical protein